MSRSFLENNPLTVLHDVARLCRTRADQLARTHGMTRAQWVILLWCQRQPGLSQNELAALIDVEPITVGRLIDRLEARGVIERRLDKTDRRIRRVHLTDAADPIMDEIEHDLRGLTARVTANVPAKTLETMIEALGQMKANLAAELREEKSA
jgi:MarR family transcriptional regulator, transcriptional regulator for hemolysin